MKRYIKTTSVILFAALTLAGCSKTEEFYGNPDSALQIESVSGISPFALTTKAVITSNTLPDSDAATGIGIFVTATDGSAYDGHDKGYSNVKYANSGSGWNTSTPIYLSDTQGKLYGYFPYNSNANDLKAIPVQSSLNGIDYLYAEPQTVSHSNKNVSLTMNHALSRLHLTIKKGTNFTASAPLSKITLKSKAIDATGTMDLATGAITASKESNETGIVEFATDGTITSEGIVKDILLVPTDNNESKKDLAISLLIDGKPAGVTLSGDNGIDIRSGIQNNVTLTIEDTGVKVEGVGVGEWSEDESQQVKVGTYTVTVKAAEYITAGDILFNFSTEGDKCTISAISKKGMALKCTRDENVKVPISEVSKGFYSFTISGISQDIVLTIGYITIKFDMNGRGGTPPADIIVEAGKTYSAPNPVEMPPISYFEGWYTTPECTTSYNFSESFLEDMTLYAKWSDYINGHLCVKLAGYYWAKENTGKDARFPSSKNGWNAGFYEQLSTATGVANSWGNESGHTWTIPSNDHWNALIDNCIWTWTSQDGKTGYKVSDKTDASKFIFLPAAGYFVVNMSQLVESQGSIGVYFSANSDQYLKFNSSSKYITNQRGVYYGATQGFGATLRLVAN